MHDPDASSDGAAPTLRIAPWPSEIGLLILVILASLAIYGILLLSIFGAIYAFFIALVVFFGHLLFIAHVRGSGVRLGPEQFPRLHERVTELGRRAGIDRLPAAYLLQAGGTLNAFATKLFRGRIIVLYSDLLEACGDDELGERARDMVIGHELGHHKAGHLDLMWLTAPGRFIPFLGAAYSRACELTCDRWGAALCGDAQAAARGLAILAAGGKYGRQVNLRAFVAQREELDTAWMTLGRWLSNYPPLSQRVAAIEPALAAGMPALSRGPLRAAGLLVGCLAVPMLVSSVAMFFWLPKVLESFKAIQNAQAAANTYGSTATPPELSPEASAAAELSARADLERLAAIVEAHARAGSRVTDELDLEDLWNAAYPDEPYPTDPFDGAPYGFATDETTAIVYSSGPDGQSATDDDIDRHIDLPER